MARYRDLPPDYQAGALAVLGFSLALVALTLLGLPADGAMILALLGGAGVFYLGRWWSRRRAR